MGQQFLHYFTHSRDRKRHLGRTWRTREQHLASRPCGRGPPPYHYRPATYTMNICTTHGAARFLHCAHCYTHCAPIRAHHAVSRVNSLKPSTTSPHSHSWLPFVLMPTAFFPLLPFAALFCAHTYTCHTACLLTAPLLLHALPWHGHLLWDIDMVVPHFLLSLLTMCLTPLLLASPPLSIPPPPWPLLVHSLFCAWFLLS